MQSPSADVIIGLDHTGIVVPDLDRAVEFYCRAFGARVVSREADTDVDPVAIGMPGHSVRLRGALLSTNGTLIELHEFIEPTGVGHRRACDTGLSHIAFAVTDIDKAFKELQNHGIQFNSQPNEITHGALAGRKWVYGQDPWGTVIELCQHPRPTRRDVTHD